MTRSEIQTARGVPRGPLTEPLPEPTVSVVESNLPSAFISA